MLLTATILLGTTFRRSKELVLVNSTFPKKLLLVSSLNLVPLGWSSSPCVQRWLDIRGRNVMGPLSRVKKHMYTAYNVRSLLLGVRGGF